MHKWAPVGVWIVLGPALAAGQKPAATAAAQTMVLMPGSGPDVSLGVLARETRAAEARETRLPRVFTNSDLPRAGDLSLVGPPETLPPAAEAAEKTDTAAEEKQWRDRFAAARTRLADDTRDLSLTQRELNLAQVQFYGNPNQDLQQQLSRSNINAMTARVAALKTAVAADQAALDALGEELRRAGLPLEWGR